MTRELREAFPVVIKSFEEKEKMSWTVPFFEKVETAAFSSFPEEKRAAAGAARETVRESNESVMRSRCFKRIPPCVSDDHSFAKGG